DSVVKLPISPACESLNAAVTLALMGYERSQQLKLFR
ncbi:RNA methyltransferase, partial [bacterium]|nr:RNA methyltransferase [bacterium]